jgi:hypothetical protein
VHVRVRCTSSILCCAQCLKHIGVSMLVYSRATRESEACSTFVCSRSTHFCASSTSYEYPWKPVYFFPRLSAPKHVGGQAAICHRWAVPASTMAHMNASINTGVRVHLPRRVCSAERGMATPFRKGSLELQWDPPRGDIGFDEQMTCVCGPWPPLALPTTASLTPAHTCCTNEGE